MCDYQKNSAINEANILSSLDHPNIIKLEACQFDVKEGNLFLMMEYASEGDLNDLVENTSKLGKRVS